MPIEMPETVGSGTGLVDVEWVTPKAFDSARALIEAFPEFAAPKTIDDYDEPTPENVESWLGAPGVYLDTYLDIG
jgi:hypothetical protein